MALPTNRQELINYCKSLLGEPVINVEVHDTQVDNCIDYALQYFADYHFDGSEKLYYKYQITQVDKDNKFILLPDNIIGAVSIFPIGSIISSGVYSAKYQFVLNNLNNLTSQSIIPYYMAMTHINLLEQIFVGKQSFRYSRASNKLYIDVDWDSMVVGEYIVVEAYGVIDPTVYTKIFRERWLLDYCVALIKIQWGTNVKKYGEMKLQDGRSFNGQVIYNEGMDAKKELEYEMLHSYSMPASDQIA